MLAKPIVIAAALFFSVSAQANSDYPENKTEPVVSHQVMDTSPHPQTTLHSPEANQPVNDRGSKGEFEHESVVFLAQGMSGFMTF